MPTGFSFESEFPILQGPNAVSSFFQRAEPFIEAPPKRLEVGLGDMLRRWGAFKAHVAQAGEDGARQEVLAELAFSVEEDKLPDLVVFPDGSVALLRHPDRRETLDTPLRALLHPFEPEDEAAVAEALAAILRGLDALSGDPDRVTKAKLPAALSASLYEKIKQARKGRAEAPAPMGRGRSREVDEALAWFARERPSAPPADAPRAAPRPAARASGWSLAAEPVDFRLHALNLRFGALSQGGEVQTFPSDVAEIAKAARDWTKTEGRRIVIYAHGGLVSEAAGADYARQAAGWWLENGVYPIFVLWESDAAGMLLRLLGETIGGGRAPGLDELRDIGIERVVRAAGTPIWDAMKRSAARASADGDEHGLTLLVQELGKAFGDARPPLHLVGHSAGAILHLHLLDRLKRQGIAPESFQMLAPAATAPLMRDKLGAYLKDAARAPRCRIYAMTDATEQADTAAVYGKSLLYLVRQGFEPVTTPIAGMQRDLDADPELVKLLAQGNAGVARETLVFSPTPVGTPRRFQSEARHHGAFDNDGPTMWSVMHFIRGPKEAAAITTFPDIPDGTKGRGGGAEGLPEELRAYFRLARGSAGGAVGGGAAGSAPAPAALPLRPPAAARSAVRRALTIGVDAYPGSSRLEGCVNDSNVWARMLAARGFHVTQHIDPKASGREQILTHLRGFVAGAASGDTLVWHFSGHGTTIRNQAQSDFEIGDFDQAIVAAPEGDIDGALIVDDEIHAALREVNKDARLYVFLDSCHSGSASRLSQAGRPRRIDPVIRPGYVPKRRPLVPGGRRAANPYRGVTHVLFSACNQDQSAYENTGGGGQVMGAFTRAIELLLTQAPAAGFANGDLPGRIAPYLGQTNQQPGVYCDDAYHDDPFPLAG